MPETYFSNTFASLAVPVIVVGDAENMPVVFANASARLLLNPLFTVNRLKAEADAEQLRTMLLLKDDSVYDGLLGALKAGGTIAELHACLISHDGAEVPVIIDANRVLLDGNGYFVIYLHNEQVSQTGLGDVRTVVATLFQLTNQAKTVDEAINQILAYIGSSVQVSRAYIFEEISAEDTRNTYEWCAPGIEPAIQDLQCLKKADYNYDVIVNGGMYITDSVLDLPENDRVILEAQGIKSLAILPLVHLDAPLGYIGFDDCSAFRKWSSYEIDLLRNATDYIVSLLSRRNSERKLIRSREVLQIISDNIENIIYVSDVYTHELVFLNKTMADTLGLVSDQLVGKICWKTLQSNQEGPCTFCPVPRMLEEGYGENGQTYTWEFENTVTNKWYLLKDSIVEWTDGRKVHIETATEITHQKLYEERLKHYASTDTMTGTYNREWGTRIMRDMVSNADAEKDAISVVFLDVDGLKEINDTCGHEMGDEAIIKMVDVVRSCIRKSDFICRWGGDEFLLVLECTVENAHNVVANIYRKLEQFNEIGGKPYTLGFSYGIAALLDAKEEPLDVVIARADKLMYENKMSRRQAHRGRQPR